jgi:hypothetical protein
LSLCDLKSSEAWSRQKAQKSQNCDFLSTLNLQQSTSHQPLIGADAVGQRFQPVSIQSETADLRVMQVSCRKIMVGKLPL